MLLAAAPSVAHASAVSWGFTTAGDPRLAYAGDTLYAAGTPWWVCPPGEQCRQFAIAPEAEPGATPRGSFFEADVFELSATQLTTFERSPQWLGRVTARNHPRVTGWLRAGQTVRPVAALWSGGWADDVTTTTIVACPASTRAQCEYLTGPNGETTGDAPRKLQDKHSGWYLYAVQQHARTAVPVAAGVAPRPVASALVAVSTPAGPVRRAKRAP
jgi:hypothetical protein